MHPARDSGIWLSLIIIAPRLLPSIFSSLATPCCSTEVTGHDSTLYLPASKLIISQTFHYVNQTTASHHLSIIVPPSPSIPPISPVHLHVSIWQHVRVAANGETRRRLFSDWRRKGTRERNRMLSVSQSPICPNLILDWNCLVRTPMAPPMAIIAKGDRLVRLARRVFSHASIPPR